MDHVFPDDDQIEERYIAKFRSEAEDVVRNRDQSVSYIGIVRYDFAYAGLGGEDRQVTGKTIRDRPQEVSGFQKIAKSPADNESNLDPILSKARRLTRWPIVLGKSKVPVAERSFRSEMERQLLEIYDAFGVFIDDTERERRRILERLHATEQQKQEIEHRIREIEQQKRGVEDQLGEMALQLRKLHKTPAMRLIRLVKRSNPFRSAR